MASGPSSSSSAFHGFKQDREEADAAAPASAPQPPQKRRRNQPGTPYPDAEVVALSPTTLLATNRFVCEVCGKGFQREQNLQLHRRGHNLPWKLRQKGSAVPRRRVYLCPEPTCVHHDPSRALGDLTGIKKHFSRKHGEKKWKCDKCSKRYAVQSDWKAHSKTCGTREYRCDCGTLFSRRDSFITHRAFCDALAQETTTRLAAASHLPSMGTHLFTTTNTVNLQLPHLTPPMPSSLHHQAHPSPELLHLGGTSSALTAQLNHLFSNPTSPYIHSDSQFQSKPFHGLMQLPSSIPAPTAAADVYNLGFFHVNNDGIAGNSQGQELLIPEHYHPPASTFPQMSATALLQRAGQMGAAASRNIAAGAFDDGGDCSEAQLQDLMNSLAGYGGCNDHGLGVMDEAALRGKGLEGLTRDFLGVGGAVELGSMGGEMKVTGTKRTFGGLDG